MVEGGIVRVSVGGSEVEGEGEGEGERESEGGRKDQSDILTSL